MTNLASLLESVEDIPDADATQHALARAYVLRHAPDLLADIFGSES